MPARRVDCTLKERAFLDKRLESSKRWQRNNPERVSESRIRNREKTKGKILVLLKKREYSEDYYYKHKEERKAFQKNYRVTHKEQRKIYAENNKESIRKSENKYRRERYESNPGYRLKMLLTNRLWKFIRVLGGTKSSIKSVIGCSWEQLRQHIESQFTEGMSWNLMGKIHIDHIIPCIAFDLSDPEQQKVCFHFTNLRPLWDIDNQIKGGKY